MNRSGQPILQPTRTFDPGIDDYRLTMEYSKRCQRNTFVGVPAQNQTGMPQFNASSVPTLPTLKPNKPTVAPITIFDPGIDHHRLIFSILWYQIILRFLVNYQLYVSVLHYAILTTPGIISGIDYCYILQQQTVKI